LTELKKIYLSNIYREAFNKQLKQLFCKKFQNNKIIISPGNVNYIGGMLSSKVIYVNKTKQSTKK